MKIPKVIVTYDEHISKKRITNIEELIEQNRFNDDEFDYFFEVFENDLVVVFAFVYGFELTQEDIDKDYGRVFQVETAVIVKDKEYPSYHGTVHYLGDNDGWGGIQELLKDSPVWTKDELRDLGVKVFRDVGVGFPDKYYYEWKHSLKP